MSTPNPFDYSIIVWINHFARRWWLFDRSVCAFESEPLLKGGVLTAFLWWTWFRRSQDKRRDQAILVAGIASAMVVMTVCRAAAFLLPFRTRPFFQTSLHFTPPLGTSSLTWINWSSFPSDHAALFFSLAMTVFFVSRRVGIFACLYTLFFICLPRIYVGDHYPTDILVGSLVGIASAWIFARPAVYEPIARRPLRVLESGPSLFYVVAYVVSLLLTTNLEIVRKAGAVVFHALRTRGAA